MTPDERRATARRWIVGTWDQGNLGLIQEMAVPDRYTYQASGQEQLPGPSFRDFVSSVRAAFPDLRNTIDSQITEGDVVVTRGTTRGTHRGEFAGIGPTGKTIDVPWVMFTSFEGDRIVADWELYDALGLMTQLGAIPASAQAT